MQNVKTAPKTTAKTAPKTASKTAPAPAPTATAAPAPFVHVHAESGVTAKHYSGLSSYLNANRKAQIRVLPARPAATLTARMLGTLRAMRDAYGTKHFIARGFDNGAVANLIAAGMLRHIENSGQIAGNIISDGETPAKLSVTATGQSYGKA
jgi:hypothetical protein